MSRWALNFETHAFNESLVTVNSAIEQIKFDDPVVLENLEEFARFKKVLVYLDQALKGVDPELLPLSFWDTVRDQLNACASQLNAFNSKKAKQHLEAANQHLDAVLTHVRPHMLAKGRLGPALQAAAKAYSKAVEDSSAQLRERAAEALNEIDASQKDAATLLIDVKANVQEIDRVHTDLFVAGEGGESTNTELQREIGEVRSFYKILLIGDGETPSIREEVSVARKLAAQEKKAIDSLRSEASKTIAALTDFETKILGSVNDSGVRDGGLQRELDARLKNLANIEEQQINRHEALSERIESLLPGATSAGLASAYRQMKDSFSMPLASSSRVFYISIASLVAVSLLVNIESVGLWNISFVRLSDWASIGRYVVHKLPFYGPLVWLAYYASKRRSEFQRLEQEYAHKEALAKSYDSYRQQIEALESGSDELMRDLLSKAVDAIAFNASTSLDGKHGDKIPVQEAIEKAVALIAKALVREKSLIANVAAGP